ncbi:hypothetical protein [Streptomyces sp. NPDC087437]|uniref:hypothetical protein n=1 Tax=Streptomyces sp. NPDC087437 TaxID=3365789 RepID=UPI0037F4C85D
MPGTRHLVEPTGFEEIYIEGGLRWRNPEDDLPGDFEATCTVHYAAIRRPMDPQAFITDLKRRMTDGLDRLSAALADGSAGAGPGSPRTRPRSPNGSTMYGRRRSSRADMFGVPRSTVYGHLDKTMTVPRQPKKKASAKT